MNFLLKKSKLKSVKGITLIALVVTIIVLLILAAVSISMLTGENGIVRNAQRAKDNTRGGEVKEKVLLAISENETYDKTDEFGYKNTINTRQSVVNKLYADKKITETEYNKLLGENGETKVDSITIGTIEIDFIDLPEGPSNKAKDLFENLAGDEEGATEGKLHIGDYLIYEPIAQGDTGNEPKYKYESYNDTTGITEAIAANRVTGFTFESQNFVAKSGLKWVVIGKDGENVLITTENPIMPENPATFNSDGYSNESTGYVLYGAKGYVNCITEIDNISKIYGNGKGADINKTRGITLEDIDGLTGMVPTDSNMLYAYGYNIGSSTYGYGRGEVEEYFKGQVSGWTPEAWILASAEIRSNPLNSPGITGMISAYWYNKPIDGTKQKLVFGNNDLSSSYWLASRGFLISFYPNQGRFNMAFVGKDPYGSTYIGCELNSFCPGYSENGYALGIRPLVYLNQNVSLTENDKSNNITTWSIT